MTIEERGIKDEGIGCRRGKGKEKGSKKDSRAKNEKGETRRERGNGKVIITSKNAFLLK